IVRLMERRLRPWEAFVAGVSAMLVATAVLGLAYLVQPGFPFPPLGLAQRLLGLVPGPLAVFFIERLGHWALRLFAAGFTVASVLAGGLAGVLVARAGARRRARAAWLAGGLLAVAALGGYRPQPGAPSLLAYGAVVAVAGVVYASVLGGSLARLGRLGRLGRDPAPAPAAGLGRARRELLRALVGGGALLATGLVLRRLGGGFGDPGGRPLVRPAGAAPVRVVAPPPDRDAGAFLGIGGLTPEVTANRDHYVVDTSIVDPDVEVGSWRLRVDGLVGGPVELGYGELLAMAAVEQYVTLQCISNVVGGDLVGTARWTGVPLRDLLARAGGAAPRAVRVAFHAVGGYSDSLALAKALEPTTVVAYGMNGRSLPRAHGYPARIIVPGIYGMKNVKWLARVEVVGYDYRGYWQRADGWDNVAEVKTASRIDVPTELSAVDGGGGVVVAGVAWAGDRGVRRVEVSADDGRSWSPAVLRRELAPAAWRQWRWAWRPGGAGRVVLRVRAVDGHGDLQTAEQRPPLPSGASGYDQVDVVTG
ncbi:MAG TPA: molybdopterin-dependent oxidoreductase, partial [Actinomycetes bacterium]|nr:molybdopterin-dependent oxidoreductase [Actinomycetes bacterium]